MAGGAGIGDLVFVGDGGSDEGERMRAHKNLGNLRFNFGHVAGHAFAASCAIPRARLQRLQIIP